MQQRKTDTFLYNLVRSNRKTMALKIEEDGSITVLAPLRMPVDEADLFVEKHREWILTRRELQKERMQAKRTYTDSERAEGKKLAKQVLEQKCRIFAKMMGVTYGTISVREQKSRWGSCSSKGNLNFNWKLVLMPEEILDYVVVHELAHRVEMNHSPAFWAIVEHVLPDYRERRAWLKDQGGRF